MPGETLALVGLRGAGHETIARAVFGDAKIESGLIKLSGKVVRLNSPASAIACGIGFISSKRAEESVAATLSVRENLFMNPGVTGIGPLNWLSLAREQERSARVIDKYSIRPRDSERSVLTLSGGNQQKVIVARWLEGNVALLILEEPTAGVDVGSKAEIYSLMQQFLSMGSAILLVSTDFEEVARVAHRALVFDRGRIVAEISRSEMTVARLTSLAAGDMMNEKAV
jgi:ribose transport system ATP-binding protein